MKGQVSSIRIAVNTMRARLTILGFNLTIVTFQITQLSHERSGAIVPGFQGPLHLPATIALHFALLLTVAAMVLLIASATLSEDGACDSPSIVGGDLLMYLGLSYTLVGFFQPLLVELALRQLPTSRETHEFKQLLRTISLFAAVAWILAAYVGPIISLLRSPFGTRWSVTLGAGYLILMVALAHNMSIAAELQSELEGDTTSRWTLIRLLFLPVDWIVPISS